MIARQIARLCPNVELDGSREKFQEYMTDLANRIEELAPPPFNSLMDFKVEGIGEVIEPDDPRHPTYADRHPEFTPLETTPTNAPQTTRG
jgi:hypothetical protein